MLKISVTTYKFSLHLFARSKRDPVYYLPKGTKYLDIL